MNTTATTLYRQAFQITPGSRAATNHEILHKTVMACFPSAVGTATYRSDANILFAANRDNPTRDRKIWRLGQARAVLIQSTIEPVAVPDGLAPMGDPFAVVHDYQEGQEVDLTATINPCRVERKTRRRYALHRPADIAHWVSTRIHGATINPDMAISPLAYPTTPNTTKTCHGMTTFTARATITDPVRFTTTITEGIGRARAYGAGLILTRPTG